MPRAPSRVWPLVAGLLIAAFVARAPLYLCVFPPFEGWDEYQHLGYIVHLDETATLPLYESRVPLTIRPLVVALPHSPWGRETVRQWGALSYAEYWTTPAPATDAPPPSSPRLYQSQHPPLAYVVALPVWRALGAARPLDAISAIRALNVLTVAGALVLFAGALPRLVPAFAPRAAALLLVCLHPLFFQNGARIANDALALATGVAGISLAVSAGPRTLLTRGLLAAVCIAASVWSKQTGLTLIPVLLLALPLVGRAQGASPGRVRAATALAGLTLLLLLAPLWWWSYQHYGSIVTTQESIELSARGPVVPALAASFVGMNWQSLLTTLFVPGRPWVGGWSDLPLHPTLADLHAAYWTGLLALAASGAFVGLWRARRNRAAGRPNEYASAGLAVCAAVVMVTALGMIHHALVSHAVFGQWMTNPWYFMTALPFLFVLAVRGLDGLDRRIATAGAAGLAALYVAIDLHGTWVQMPRAYTGTTDVALQWSRLSSIHPALLGGDLRWAFLGVELGALLLAIGGLAYASLRTRG